VTSSICSRVARAALGRRLTHAALAASAAMFAAQTPFAASVAQAQAAGVTQHDHWMADNRSLGRLTLGQVILPASHDSATYGFLSQKWDGRDPPAYTTNQDIDVSAQLQHGIRVLDLRGRKFTWDGTEDFYVYHGGDTTNLSLGSVLDDVQRWVLAPGHDKEVVVVQVDASPDKDQSGSPTVTGNAAFNTMCGRFKQNFGALMLTPDTFAGAVNLSVQQHVAALTSSQPDVPVLQFAHLGNTDLGQYTMDEVWSLPHKERVIVKWPDCVGAPPSGMFNGYWANQCYAGEYSAAAKTAWAITHAFSLNVPDPSTFARPGIIGADRAALSDRLQNKGGDGQFGGLGAIATQPTTFVNGPGGTKVPTGLYTLGVHASITPECGYPLAWFLDEQAATLDTVKNWFDTGQFGARDHLNIISADLVEQSKLVEYAIAMNQPQD
jgi:hypothetical protein